LRHHKIWNNLYPEAKRHIPDALPNNAEYVKCIGISDQRKRAILICVMTFRAIRIKIGAMSVANKAFAQHNFGAKNDNRNANDKKFFHWGNFEMLNVKKK